MPATTFGVKLDDRTRERLKRLGELRDRSPHWLMKQAIARYLEQEERYERERAEDQERWQRFAATGNAVPHDEAKARLTALAQRLGRRTGDG